MNGLVALLEQLGLGKHAKVMADNDIDLDVLPHLSDEDFKELGLSLGHRRKLMNALQDEANTDIQVSTKPKQLATATENAERRQLTVMFCDLVGSTELSQKLDPEDLREVLGRYHNAVARTITSHQGHVAKLMGDGVLAYFGWPRAHEDQAELAIHAAMAAVREVGGLDGAGAPLAARVGIATGQVVIGDMMGETVLERGAVAGETPNLAARLQGMARPGEVIINDATRRLAGGSFVLEDAGAHQLKGFSDTVAVWRVVAASRTASQFEALHGGNLTEFVGREHEIGLLDGRWRLARCGEGQVVLLSGEAGLGKSRILREFTRRLDASACQVLRYQCSQHEINAAFQPLIAEIEDTSGISQEDPVEARLDKLERHLETVLSGWAEAAPMIASLLGLPAERYPEIEMAPQRRKQRLTDLLGERIIGLARSSPVVLLIEDIHWIDPSTLEVLDALVERMESLSVLAVMTHRPEFQPRWGGFGHVTLHSLNRLGRGDRKAIIERIAGGKSLPDEVLTLILKQTDGIPLFVEELTKVVLEAGILKERDDRYELNGPLPALAIPETLQGSLMARLDRLATVKWVIQAASCIGREFGAELLASALSMGETELDAALEQLLTAELIFRRGGSGEARYIFKHALVQDTAYTSLLTPARRSLHERLALALEQARDPDTLELARHFHAAGANERAAKLYLGAGRRSLDVSALPEAIGALEQGLKSIGALPVTAERDRMELELRVALGAARMANFGWAHPSVSEAFEPAFALARNFGDTAALGSILWGLWVHYQTRTKFPRAHEWLSELKTVAAENGQSDLPLVYGMSAGCQYFWEADFPRALGHTDRLKLVYDRQKHAGIVGLTNHDPLVFSQHWAGSLADWIAGRPDRSVERLEEAVSLARRVGHPFNLVFALTAGATSLVYLDQPEELLELCDEAARTVEEEALGPFSEHVNVMQWRGAALVRRGDFEIGHALVKRGNDFWTASGGRICAAMFRSWIVLGLLGLGRIGEATELNVANIDHCRETGDRYMEAECVRLQGELTLLAQTSDFAAAERSFLEAIAIARTHGAKSWELRAAMSLARLLKSHDRRVEAVACLEPVLSWFTEGLESSDLRQARSLLSELA